MVSRQVDIVGRDAQLDVLRTLLGAGGTPRALVLSGGAGIGKSTLWEAALAAAREAGAAPLATRAGLAESGLSFAGLGDLLETVDVAALPGLPGPQRRALEIALLRAEPGRAPPEARAIALGFLNTLRALAAERPLLVAIDDVQWLDRASADAIAFAARRLDGEAVSFLLARRPGRPSPVERALDADRIEIGPLSLGAIRRILSDRLGLSLPRHLLRRVVDATVGNPLFALELGRVLVERGLPGVGEELPVPDRVEELLGKRVTRLRPAVRRLLLVVALTGELGEGELRALADGDTVEEAVDAGVLVAEGGRVRASHPLLAAAARGRSRPRDRRELHRTLAEVVAGEERRVRHLALAAEQPDEELAGRLARGADAASSRGARREAVELAEHALRLSPADSTERPSRLLALAAMLVAAGDVRRLPGLLGPSLEELPPGPLRARAHLLLCEGMETLAEAEPHLEQALAESASDPGLHAFVLAEMSSNRAVIAVERVEEAERRALDALPAAREAGPDVARDVLHAVGWARSLRGRPIEDVCAEFEAISGDAFYLAGSPDRVAAQRHVWRGELGPARELLTGLAAVADERGEAISYALVRLHLCELELRIGNWDAAARLLDEWADPAERALLHWPMYERCRALLAAGRGRSDEARRTAEGAIAAAERAGVGWDRLEAQRALGVAELLARLPEPAVSSLGAVWEHTCREGVDEPGVFPVAPDLVEALVELDALAEARSVTGRLSRLAADQDHPWALAAAKRCGGLVALAGEGADEGVAMLEGAAADQGELGLRFDRARTLLVLGRAQRRRRKWAAARSALEQARSAFDELGSDGWAAEAGSELARLGGRQPGSRDELTPTERRVAELAGDGRSNKEIAQALFVTVHTVEVHLSRVYAKLGVRSRSQLAASLRP
ncbi:MAG TPA: AAA family ATPase [Gaiellaceae bacterium]|nr:AAA family ATPase [Gaiellaceae bacterium]